MSRSPTITADLLGSVALAAAGICFGLTFAVVRQVLGQISPGGFLLERFSLAALVMWLLSRNRPASRGLWRDGLLPGLALGAAYLLQTMGLETVTGSVSALLTYLLVVIVPLLEAIWVRKVPTRPVLVGAFVAVAGLVVMGSGGPGHSFGIQDAETAASACLFALNIVALGRVAERHDPLRLGTTQMSFVALVALPEALASRSFVLNASVLSYVLLTALVASVGAFWLQIWGQRHVSASRASLLLMAEPVVAVALGWLLGAPLRGSAAVGAALLVGGILLSEIWTRRSQLARVPREPALPSLTCSWPAVDRGAVTEDK